MSDSHYNIAISENPTRLCGSIIEENPDNEWIITGLMDDICPRDFVICTLHHIDVTAPRYKQLYAYIGRPGVEEERQRRSMLTTIEVLSKMHGEVRRSKHVPRLVKYGYTPRLVYGQDDQQDPEYDPQVRKRFVFIVEHEHTMLSVLLGLSPFSCLPVLLTLQIGIGMVRALAAVHRAGYVHRLVMPHSFAYHTGCSIHGFADDMILIDFSLCMPWPVEPRIEAPFVGTLRYSSYRAHMNKEQTPADDIISVIYTVAELITGKLPWSFDVDVAAIVKKKANFEKDDIFMRMPHEIRLLYQELMGSNELILDHKKVIDCFKNAIKRLDPKKSFKLPEWLHHPRNHRAF